MSKENEHRYDVYSYGMIANSTVYCLDDRFSYPQPNQYAEIARRYPSIGGEAVNSAVTLARLGLKVKLAGVWLGGAHADTILNLLGPYDIDTSRLTRRKEAVVCDEIVITDNDSRTVFGNYAAFHEGPVQWDPPAGEDIQNSRYAVIDPYLRDDSRAAAALCVRHGVPYVTSDCRYDDPVARNAAAVIISHELRDMTYPDIEARELFELFRGHCSGLLIFTFGSKDAWYVRGDGEVKSHVPFSVEAVDTTGAGDSFRGGILYGLIRKWEDEKVMDFAAAVAALVCLSVPHALNAPDLETVLAFLKERKRR